MTTRIVEASGLPECPVLQNGHVIFGAIYCPDIDGTARWVVLANLAGAGQVTVGDLDHNVACWTVDSWGHAYWGAYGPKAGPAFAERVRQYTGIRMNDE